MQKSHSRSLGCVKIRDVSELIVKPMDTAWTGRKRHLIDQLVLFDPVETKLEKIPFVFKYRYRCESSNCPGHNQSILDWELMELYRGLRDQGAQPNEIEAKIRSKFIKELCSPSKDTHFIVGNHSLYPSTFMVLGVFWPPKSPLRELF
jgi:hypothetical protein